MKLSSLKISSAALLPSVATMLVVQACGGSGDASAKEKPDAIVGVWEAVVTQRDCTSGNPVATFRASQVMHHGGTLTDTPAALLAARGVGFGTWSNNPDGTYAAKFRFYRFNTDGTLAGSAVVTTTRTLSADTNGYTGVTRTELRDLAGSPIATLCVTDAGTRAL